MTGAHKPYWHQSMFWSDLGPNVGFEAIGLTDSELQTVAVYAKGRPDDNETQKEDSEGNREQNDAAVPTASELKHKLSESKTTTPTNDNKDDYRKGVVFYLKENKVVGIVLWNVFNRIPIARKVKRNQSIKLIFCSFSFYIDYQRSTRNYKFSRTCKTFQYPSRLVFFVCDLSFDFFSFSLST